jgi:hypothetical protein
VNVRSEPDQTGDVLGQLPINTDVQIIGTDFTKSWYQIIYPDGPDGLGWVAGQFVQTEQTPEVPVIGAGAASTPPPGVQGQACDDQRPLWPGNQISTHQDRGQRRA